MNGTAPSPARTAKLPHVSDVHMSFVPAMCAKQRLHREGQHTGALWLSVSRGCRTCLHSLYARMSDVQHQGGIQATPRTHPSTAYECARSHMQDHRVAGGRTKRTRSSRKVASEAPVPVPNVAF